MRKSKISRLVKKLRIDHELSQEGLSEESGLSLRTIQRIESGESYPREDTLKMLAKAFNVPVECFEDHHSGNGIDSLDLTKKTFPWYIIGSTIVGASMGLFLGITIITATPIVINDAVSGILVAASTLLFSGIGLIIGNILEKRHIR